MLTEFASFVHRGSLEGHFRIGGGVRSDPVCPKSFIQTYLFLQAGVLAQQNFESQNDSLDFTSKLANFLAVKSGFLSFNITWAEERGEGLLDPEFLA